VMRQPPAAGGSGGKLDDTTRERALHVVASQGSGDGMVD
jgi:hypothetical protein